MTEWVGRSWEDGKMSLLTSEVECRMRNAECGVRRRPWTPEEEALLGTAPDTEIARKLKRDISTV
jgi:hypothetical protein